jgi:hypothetical protein
VTASRSSSIFSVIQLRLFVRRSPRTSKGKRANAFFVIRILYKHRKKPFPPVEVRVFFIYKGDGRNVHVQTKGCMFYCDLFHTLNLSRFKGKCNKLTLLSQIRHTLDVYPLREAERTRSSANCFM